MVTTRRQEQLMHTPPSQQQRQDTAQQEESPATPFGAGAGAAPSARGQGGTALRLKSALKPARLAAVQDEAGDEGTPTDAGIKKRVRIHSANNMIHEFQPSMSIDDAASLPGPLAGLRFSEGASDDEHTPDSSGPRRRRPPTPARPSLQRYRGFLAGVLNVSSSSSSSADSGSRGGNRGRGSRGSARSTWGRDLLGMLFTLGWMLASSALIFANKQLMVDHGFRFPFALTAMGQASSTLPAWLASVVGLAPLRPPPPLRTMLTRLLPVSLSFAASLFLGNVAYLGLSVAFINIMKAATPMVTLALGLALGLERLSKLTLLATGLIALGTYTATASEAASGHFQWLSFLAFAASVVFEGIRVVMTEKLLGQAKYNVMEALVYLGPFTFGILAAGAYVFEWEGLCTQGWAVMQARPHDFLVAMAICFLVNLFCYLAIKYVSATSFKVAGCLKNVLVVWGGILQGDVVTPRELQGYAISLGGFLLFSASRWRAALKDAGVSGDSASPPKRRR
ncbi:hypothetical protein ABPG77_004714 [Micractinium sp. CCAP 211/92]